MRVVIEAREFGGVHRVEQDADSDNWLDGKRNDAARREGVIDAANALLRGLGLEEITEAAS